VVYSFAVVLYPFLDEILMLKVTMICCKNP